MNPLRVRFVEGVATFVYDDRLAELLTMGPSTVERVSNVEPAPSGGWTAAMLNGPVLGPFALRAEALNAERVWLREHKGV